jgi:N-formylglutamate deformylase
MYTLIRGHSPLVLSLPHVGTVVPEDIAAQLTPAALALPDTDWHVDQLYDFAFEAGHTVIRAINSRYVIDLNRPSDDAALYPAGSNTSGLCPTLDFAGNPLYRTGIASLAPEEIARRVATYWMPYHTELAAQIEAARKRHGHALLIDGHSIRSQVPRLFEGRLPDINIGTADGRSCSAAVRAGIREMLDAESAFSHVIDGRFKGGHITRHYGAPRAGVHAIQIELAQCAYMSEDSPAYNRARALPMQAQLRSMLDRALEALRG